MEYYILDYTSKPLGESGEDGENCNNQYDLSQACDACGTGARLIGNLRTKGLSKVKKDFFSTLDDDYIISEQLFRILNENNIKIGDLVKIVDFRNKELPFYHLKTDFYFPKAKEIKGLKIDRQCQRCKRNGYFTDAIIGNLEKNIPTKVPPLEFIYNIIDNNLLKQSDIFNTWEFLGLSNLKREGNKIIRYARSLMIVSGYFKDCFEQNSIKDIKFEPITIAS